ncbi:MAG TPA: HEPN domain-containing protein [Chloroflexota bacterium]|nr:HEPN domain-containing protein [Chloroflexota bacterium]
MECSGKTSVSTPSKPSKKALKALLVNRSIPFRFSHDIAALLTDLQQAAIEIPAEVLSSATLTDYAVSARYPGTAEPVAEMEYLEAVALATTTVAWVEQRMIESEGNGSQKEAD